jgi:hypothetical protein
MKISGKKVALVSSIILVFIAVAYFSGSSLLSGLIEKRIISTIEKMKADGIEVRYDSLHAFPDKIVFKQLQVIVHNQRQDGCVKNDSVVKISYVKITGLELLPMLLHRSLKLDSVILKQPYVVHSTTRNSKDKKEKENKNGLRNIFINHISIEHGALCIVDSTQCEDRALIRFNSDVSELSLNNLDQDSVLWRVQKTTISSIVAKFPREFYTINIREAAYVPSEKTFQIDSIRVNPDYNKRTFAQMSKRQIDRIEGYIPTIKGTGFEITQADNKALIHTTNINVSFNLDIFRDKRYPFKNNIKSLPVKYLHHLPLSIQIDTVHINNSYVAYEEFQEDGTEPGKVFFDNLYCQINHISNQSNSKTSMNASAKFMDDGLLKATFTFPSDPEGAYTVKGKLTNFSLPAVNAMLTTAAHAEISKGTLEEMNFNFTYNDTRSDGKVELNYKDLKMTSLLKNKERKNKFLTFLLRLVVKEDMDDNLPTDQKTGDILFYRDKRRSIFNYWWKSILSGIKSVYNLDKITDTDGSKKH